MPGCGLFFIEFNQKLLYYVLVTCHTRSFGEFHWASVMNPIHRLVYGKVEHSFWGVPFFRQLELNTRLGKANINWVTRYYARVLGTPCTWGYVDVRPSSFN